MNKSQLIEALAKAEGLTIKKAEMVINTMFGSVEEALVRGDRVEIRGFGSFKVKDYDGYQGRNPKTGEVVPLLRRLAEVWGGEGARHTDILNSNEK